MSILKYTIEDNPESFFSAWVDKIAEKVIIETDENVIECSFEDWLKLTGNIKADIEAYKESRPKKLWGKYQIVKKID
jgi:hypothetical protein